MRKVCTSHALQARGDEARLLDFVHYTIAADLARLSPATAQSETIRVDVERLFASVDLLVNRYDQPWSPFVATWHPGLESFSPSPTLRSFDLTMELTSFERALARQFDPRR